jgi:hypothetical protein
MYHNIHSFGKQDGIDSSHLELYFYDNKMIEVITMLVNILKGNPYSEVLKTMGQLEDVDEYRISLNLDPEKDKKTYNLPVASEITTVWVDG